MPTKISTQNIQSASLTTLEGPKISNVQITDSSGTILDDTAVALTGGYIKLTGNGFQSGCQIKIGDQLATSVTFVSATEVRAQVAAASAGTYDVYLVNSDGSYVIMISGLTYSATPTWITASTLPNQVVDIPISIQLEATGATTYSLQSGSSLPAGVTLSSGGLISGTVTGITEETIYNFTVEAIDTELQDSPRTFSLSAVVSLPPASVEYLVVAGGGGGGAGGASGGGGAGGMLYGSNLSVNVGTSYTITVGSGGAGGNGSIAVNGSNSSIMNSSVELVKSIGGGYGGQFVSWLDARAGGNGGSGGGGGGYIHAGLPGGIGTPGQGNDGGAGATNPFYRAGGGGGAGQVGSNSVSSGGGPGGNGLQWPTGSGNYYAGGGGGGSITEGPAYTPAPGGLGGGGIGGKYGQGDQQPTAGTINTGGGGGGGSVGQSGGSGIVIIRYSDTFNAATSTTGSPEITVAGGYRVYKWTGSGSIIF